MNAQTTIDRPKPQKRASSKLPAGEVKKAHLRGVRTPGAKDDLSTFAGRLRYARELAGVTGQYMADRLGCTRQGYATYESRSQPDYDRLYQIADILGVSAAFLAFGEREVRGQVIKMDHNEALVNIDQYFWENGRFLKKASFAFPKDYAIELAAGRGYSNLGIYRVTLNGERVIVNKAANSLSNEADRWLVIFNGAPHVVGYIPSANADVAKMQLVDGPRVTIGAADVKVVGAVVGSISPA